MTRCGGGYQENREENDWQKQESLAAKQQEFLQKKMSKKETVGPQTYKPQECQKAYKGARFGTEERRQPAETS